MGWMHWTWPTAILFVSIGLLLGAMTVWELRSPSLPRKGLLPMTTTRGDRLFIALLATAFLVLTWVGVAETAPWPALPPSLVVLVLLLRYG